MSLVSHRIAESTCEKMLLRQYISAPTSDRMDANRNKESVSSYPYLYLLKLIIPLDLDMLNQLGNPRHTGTTIMPEQYLMYHK